MDAARLRQHVETLAGTPRVPGTVQHRKASQYIHDTFRSYGLATSIVWGADTTNVIAEVGDPDWPLFVIGAHYDSVPGSPGADDNASGVAALLEIAREYQPYKRPSHMSFDRCAHRVQFVAYDREEDGLLGSIHHCIELKKQRAEVFGMISLEMLGYTDASQRLVPGVEVKQTKGDFLAVVANPKSAPLLKLFEGLISTRTVEAVTVQNNTEAAQLARLSDHGAFWGAGWKALLATDTAFLRNPHYHQPTDTPATLDYDFLKDSAELAGMALARVSVLL